MPSHSQSLRLPLITIVLTLLCVLTVGAQSGRKVRKTTTPAPVPIPSPETNAAKPKEQPKPALTVVVGMERSFYYGGTASAGAGGVLLTMVDRLEDHPGVKVAHVWRDMTRSDAVRRARSEKEAYVILLELSFDRAASSANGDEVRLSYWVYSPGTAKIKTSGQTYPQWYRNRGVIMKPRTPNIYGDYQLEAASRDAAERILKAFHLHIPSGRRAT